MANNIVFRRIHGRVVPIKAENDHHVAKGTATAGAGLGAGYATGKLSARLTHEAANVANSAKIMHKERHEVMAKAVMHGPIFVQASKDKTADLLHYARLNEKISVKMDKRAFRVRHLGTAAVAGLVASGIHQATKGTALEKNPKTRAAVSVGAGAAASFAVHYGFLRGVGDRSFRVIRRAAKHILLKV